MTSHGTRPDCGKPKCAGKTGSVVGAFRFVRRPYSERCAPRWKFLAILSLPHSSGVAKYLKEFKKKPAAAPENARIRFRSKFRGRKVISVTREG
jgi:hypothetical protein